jgi:hypothetical protein
MGIKDKNTQAEKEFEEVRKIRFVTDSGLDSIPPELVMYTMPHIRQRYFCHWDVARPLICLSKNLPPSEFKSKFEGVPQVKMRFVPYGADATASEATDVSVVQLPYDDPAMALGNGFGGYKATKGKNYYMGNFPSGRLKPNTTYMVQYFLEWPKAPPSNPNMAAANMLRTKVFTRVLADSQAIVSQRELLNKRLRLGSNQKQIFKYVFRTSQYPAIYLKMKDLQCDQIAFRELLWGKRPGQARKVVDILAPDSRNWDEIARRLKAEFSSEAWEGNSLRTGILLYTAGFNGPEKFDIFDVNGYYRTYQDGQYTQNVKILPLMDTDNRIVQEWWNNYYDEATRLLGLQGIREQGGEFMPFIWGEAWLNFRVNFVMPPISENPDIPSGMYSLPMVMAPKYQAGNPKYLIEIFRSLAEFGISYPNQITAPGALINHLINQNPQVSDGPMADETWYGNIGVAYDQLGKNPGPKFNIQQPGGWLGPVKINAIQPEGAAPINIQWGKN